MALEFVGSSLVLSSRGLAAVTQNLSVKAAEVWAVISVETSACGFLDDRRPSILFERHVFHNLTNGRFDDGDISAPNAGGYGAGGAHQYDRLAKAIAKDRQAALKSASWGLGQILGTNHSAAGFSDVEAMVKAMSDSEDAQLSAFSSFLRSTGIDSALQAHDWTTFARKYNGPNYAQNHYDARLRGQYQKYVVGVTPDLDVRAAQLYLTFAGFHPGPVDGVLGTRTRSAIEEFQSAQHLPVTGNIEQTLLDKLAQIALGIRPRLAAAGVA